MAGFFMLMVMDASDVFMRSFCNFMLFIRGLATLRRMMRPGTAFVARHTRCVYGRVAISRHSGGGMPTSASLGLGPWHNGMDRVMPGP